MYSNEINSTQSEDDGKNEKRSMESEWKPKRKCRGMEVTADILLINNGSLQVTAIFHYYKTGERRNLKGNEWVKAGELIYFWLLSEYNWW